MLSSRNQSDLLMFPSSHIFCRDCVQKYGFQDPAGGRRNCLACGTGLPSPKDVIFTRLRPDDEYQSTILSGLDPNTILECAGKALRFWNYQMSTEMYCVLTSLAELPLTLTELGKNISTRR